MSPSLVAQKTTQALNFFARKAGGEINRMKALKLVFFADRYHLRKYGRPVSGDHYFAMANGPVASEAKNIAELRGLPTQDLKYAEQFIESSRYSFSCLADLEEGVFSETDLEALTFAWKNFGRYDKFQLSDITHLYPEWEKHRNSLKKEKRAPMDFLDFFQDPIGRADPCHVLTERDRVAAISLFQEHQAFLKLWK